ncbi:hypothetical protein [Pseudomonas sp. PIC25]|nr:hypothetical protein [Pseudomonas sp. PIC25]
MNKYLKVIVAVMVFSVSVAFLALVYSDRVIFSFYGGGWCLIILQV